MLACREQPFLFLVKHDQLGVQEGGALLSEGEHCITTNADAGYALHVYKNPKVGGKAARVVPLMTNCAPEEHNTVSKSGKPVPGVIQAYSDLAGGVDTANQLALQWRERGRFRKWSNSVRAFMLRYAATNAYLAPRYTKSIHHDCSMYDFQLLALEHMFPRESAPDHTPSKRTSRGRCVVCGQRTYWWCPTCNVPLHVNGRCWTVGCSVLGRGAECTPLLIAYKECLYVFLAWSGLLQDGMAAHGLHIGCTELTVAAHGLHVLGMAAQWLHTCSQMAALMGYK